MITTNVVNHISDSLLRCCLPPANLGLETALNSIDGPTGTTRLAGHEENTIFLREECIR